MDDIGLLNLMFFYAFSFRANLRSKESLVGAASMPVYMERRCVRMLNRFQAVSRIRVVLSAPGADGGWVVVTFTFVAPGLCSAPDPEPGVHRLSKVPSLCSRIGMNVYLSANVSVLLSV